MALEYSLETLEGLDTSLHSLYKQTDNGFVLEVNGVETPDSIAPLKNANDRNKQEAQELRNKLKELEAKAEMEKQSLERSHMEENNQQAELAQSYKSELEALKAANAEAEKQRIEGLLQSKANELGAMYASTESNAKILAMVFRNNLEANEDGLPVGKGGLDIDVLMQNMKSSGDYDSLWKGVNSTGGGANGGTNAPEKTTGTSWYS